MCSMTLLICFFSLNLWYEIRRFLIFKLLSNFRDLLVSSHKIMSDFFKTSIARKVISFKFPMGVETIYKVLVYNCIV